jgi:hypothetical protein
MLLTNDSMYFEINLTLLIWIPFPNVNLFIYKRNVT